MFNLVKCLLHCLFCLFLTCLLWHVIGDMFLRIVTWRLLFVCFVRCLLSISPFSTWLTLITPCTGSRGNCSRLSSLPNVLQHSCSTLIPTEVTQVAPPHVVCFRVSHFSSGCSLFKLSSDDGQPSARSTLQRIYQRHFRLSGHQHHYNDGDDDDTSSSLSWWWWWWWLSC